MLKFLQLCMWSFLLVSLVEGKKINLLHHLQPDHVEDLNTLEYDESSGTLCTRKCVKGAPPRLCYYRFTLESYAALSAACGNCPENITECYNPQCIMANGHERSVLSVNRKIPGPSIQVCLGDRIIVDVTNNMLGRETSIHWHGLYLNGQNYMDGADMFTQCPIVEGTTFRYDFYVDNPGTFFWHSHVGFQKEDGIMGNFIVREPLSEDPNHNLYDFDMHAVLIQDWANTGNDERYPGLRNNTEVQEVNSILVEGQGRLIKNGRETTKTPYKIFRVTPGKRYRFRLVGGLCYRCPVRVVVEGHKLLVIAVEGIPTVPISVDAVTLWPANRVDVVIAADKDPRSYVMYFQLIGECQDVQQLAILQYEGSSVPKSIQVPEILPPYPNFKELNRIDGECGPGLNGICMHQLRGILPIDKRLMKPEADINLILNYSMTLVDPRQFFRNNNFVNYIDRHGQWVVTFNGIASTLTENNGHRCLQYPNGTSYCDKYTGICHCLYVIHIPLGAVVQLLLADQTENPITNHPFHIHGYSFVVLTSGNFTGGKTYKDVEEEVKHRLQDTKWIPPSMDTVPVAKGGYSVVRFIADNPGYWLFHCHILIHQHTGMQILLKIGEDSEMPRVPKDFPSCGSYTPKVIDDGNEHYSGNYENPEYH